MEEILKEIQGEVAEKFQASKEKVFKSEEEQIILNLEASQSLGLKSSGKDWSEEVVPSFTVEEVTKLISGLRDGRAPGYDFINARMIQMEGKSFHRS